MVRNLRLQIGGRRVGKFVIAICHPPYKLLYIMSCASCILQNTKCNEIHIWGTADFSIQTYMIPREGTLEIG
jgi:hypothetical protein